MENLQLAPSAYTEWKGPSSLPAAHILLHTDVGRLTLQMTCLQGEETFTCSPPTSLLGLPVRGGKFAKFQTANACCLSQGLLFKQQAEVKAA